MGGIFINYRRGDSHEITQRLAHFVMNEFGKTNAFFDQTTPRPGMAWPAANQDALQQAHALLVVIGPDWLHMQDEKSGRRRIDLPNDWVRLEIVAFLERKKSNPNLLVLPVLVNGMTMPRAEYLDGDLKRLCDHEPLRLQATSTPLEFAQIKQILVEHRVSSVKSSTVITPRNSSSPRQLTAAEENEFLAEYKHWQMIEQPNKSSSTGGRQLYRLYEFNSYEMAWRFMERVNEAGIRVQEHHPRWQNTFNRVEVWLSTGHRPSKKDIRLAKAFEHVWEEMRSEMLHSS